jgi:uncharacterized phage-associated protein
MSTPLLLSNNFVLKALKENISLSPMKLQKIIYFTYRDYLQLTNARLFSELISAWKFGPVVESVYNHFKPFGSSSISKFYRNSGGEVLILSESVDPFGGIIQSVWNKYRHYNGIELSKITHQEGSAWYKAWTTRKKYLDDKDIKNEQLE